MSRPPTGLRGRLLPVAAVVAGLALVYGAGVTIHPATIGSTVQLGQASRAVVSAATRACPAPGTVGVPAASLATASMPGTAGPGSAVVTRLSGSGSAGPGAAVRTLTAPGVLTVSHVPPAPGPRRTVVPPGGAVPTIPGRGGVMVQAGGALAQGLEAEQAGADGLVTAQCPAPGTDFWFVGPGVSSAARIELYLMNTDSQPADAAVTALSDSGPVLGSSDTGIVVPPHGMVVQPLGTFLRGSRVIALHVSTTMGRVAAAVREARSPAAGGGWLPVTQEPSRHLVIPGLPSSAGARDLLIAVPGSGNAQIKVTAVTPKGSYQPTGGNGIDLAGNSVAAIRLPSLSSVPAAIQISSTAPVTAAAMVPGGAAGAPGALAAATAPISEQGIAADNPAGAAGSADLIISAPGAAVSVRIATATAKSTFASHAGTVVHVAARHTIVTRIRPPAGPAGAFAVVVTPLAGSGPVYVGRTISSGGVIRSILPVTSALTWVPLPAAREALDAVTPGR